MSCVRGTTNGEAFAVPIICRSLRVIRGVNWNWSEKTTVKHRSRKISESPTIKMACPFEGKKIDGLPTWEKPQPWGKVQHQRTRHKWWLSGFWKGQNVRHKPMEQSNWPAPVGWFSPDHAAHEDEWSKAFSLRLPSLSYDWGQRPAIRDPAIAWWSDRWVERKCRWRTFPRFEVHPAARRNLPAAVEKKRRSAKWDEFDTWSTDDRVRTPIATTSVRSGMCLVRSVRDESESRKRFASDQKKREWWGSLPLDY